MSEYCIITDSSCDLSQQDVDSLGIEVIPLTVNAEGRDYRNFSDNRDIDPSEFYRMLRGGASASTSAANAATFIDVIEPKLQAGLDVLVLAFSSGLSATYSAAVSAASELGEKYPERKVYVVDTLCASMGQGLLVYLTAKEKEKGADIDSARDFAEKNKLHICHWFTVDDLHFLHRGGRVSKSVAVIGTALNIKPVLHVDNEGKLIKMSAVRGRKASIKALVDKMFDTVTDTDTVFISHGDCEADAKYLEQLVRERFEIGDLHVNFIGPVIGAHSGPETLALFFVGSVR